LQAHFDDWAIGHAPFCKAKDIGPPRALFLQKPMSLHSFDGGTHSSPFMVLIHLKLGHAVYPVHCLVVPHAPGDIVLGLPFRRRPEGNHMEDLGLREAGIRTYGMGDPGIRTYGSLRETTWRIWGYEKQGSVRTAQVLPANQYLKNVPVRTDPCVRIRIFAPHVIRYDRVLAWVPDWSQSSRLCSL
jgi:hypothetical protein